MAIPPMIACDLADRIRGGVAVLFQKASRRHASRNTSVNFDVVLVVNSAYPLIDIDQLRKISGDEWTAKEELCRTTSV